jgi:hypothetical protein
VTARRPLDELHAAVRDLLDQGDKQRAAELIGRVESRLLLDGYKFAAGELGYARWQLTDGNVAGAIATVERLATEGTLR